MAKKKSARRGKSTTKTVANSKAKPVKKTKSARSAKKGVAKLDLAEIKRRLLGSGAGKKSVAQGAAGDAAKKPGRPLSAAEAVAKEYPNMKIVKPARAPIGSDRLAHVATSPCLADQQAKYGGPSAVKADAAASGPDSNLQMFLLAPKDDNADTRAPVRKAVIYQDGVKIAAQG
jgi:hypothetical protein